MTDLEVALLAALWAIGATALAIYFAGEASYWRRSNDSRRLGK